MAFSSNTFTYAGVDEFDLNFTLGYASQNDISCVKNGATPVALNFTWLTDSRVQLVSGHGLVNGDTITFNRTVSKSVFPVDVTVAGKATRESINLLSKHVMYAIHEVLDGRIADSVVIEDTVVTAVEDAVNNALASLSVTLQQFEQLFFGFYSTYDGQVEYIVSAFPASCDLDGIQVDVQTNPTSPVQFLISNDGSVKATVDIATDGTVTKAVPGGGTTFSLVAGRTTCEISGGTSNATLECGITVSGGVDVSSVS